LFVLISKTTKIKTVQIYNIHTHIFTSKNVPDRFLPFFLVRFLAKFNLTKKFAKTLHSINPFSSEDVYDRYANFLNENNRKSTEEIFLDLKKYYPQDTGFVALSMDFEYMNAGICKEGYFSQLHDLQELKQKYKDSFFPFLAIDPRRENLLDIVKEYIETKNFSGIKIYPPLGFYPFDQRLYPVYEYAEKNQIPITTHCSKGGVYFRGRINKKELVHPKTGEVLMRQKNIKFGQNYSNPENYKFLLKDFPSLKLNIGHFGGYTDWLELLKPKSEVSSNNWVNKVLELISTYPNVYADVSYTLYEKKFVRTLKSLLTDVRYKDKILFGSDFYMTAMETSENSFSNNLKKDLGEELYNLIAATNNKRFLNI